MSVRLLLNNVEFSKGNGNKFLLNAVADNSMSQVLEAIEQKRTEANDSINNNKTTSMSAIDSNRNDSIAAIENKRTTSVADVNTAGSTQLGKVNAAGEKYLKDVSDLGTQKVQAVESKGNECVESINSVSNQRIKDINDAYDEFEDVYDKADEVIGKIDEASNKLEDEYTEVIPYTYTSTISPFVGVEATLYIIFKKKGDLITVDFNKNEDGTGQSYIFETWGANESGWKKIADLTNENIIPKNKHLYGNILPTGVNGCIILLKIETDGSFWIRTNVDFTGFIESTGLIIAR